MNGLSSRRLLTQAQIVRLADAEDRPHGVPGGDRGQKGLVPRDEVSHRHLLLADDAGDGGADLAELQVQLGDGDGGLGPFNRGQAEFDRRLGVVQVHFRGGRFGHQRLQAGHIPLGLAERGLGLGQAAAGLLQGRFERPLVDHEQELPGLDLAALLEEDLFEEPVHPGAYRHGFARLGPGHIFPVERNGRRRHGRHHHRRGRRAAAGPGPPDGRRRPSGIRKMPTPTRMRWRTFPKPGCLVVCMGCLSGVPGHGVPAGFDCSEPLRFEGLVKRGC